MRRPHEFHVTRSPGGLTIYPVWRMKTGRFVSYNEGIKDAKDPEEVVKMVAKVLADHNDKVVLGKPSK
jgi:hypothetical protein